MNNTTPETMLAGEKYLENWLSENGYSNIVKNTEPGRPPVIEANGSLENIFITIKIVLSPNKPLKLKNEEIMGIKTIENAISRKPYIAYIVIDEANQLVGEIMWERIS